MHVGEYRQGELAPFVHPAVFGCDRRLADPGLEPLHVRIVLALDLCEHRGEVGLLGIPEWWDGDGRGSSRRVLQKRAAIDHGDPR